MLGLRKLSVHILVAEAQRRRLGDGNSVAEAHLNKLSVSTAVGVMVPRLNENDNLQVRNREQRACEVGAAVLHVLLLVPGEVPQIHQPERIHRSPTVRQQAHPDVEILFSIRCKLLQCTQRWCDVRRRSSLRVSWVLRRFAMRLG
jgi:hypothetical protein